MVTASTDPAPGSSLATWLIGTRFKNWRTNRTLLQVKWEENREAFKAISDGAKHWKTGDAETWRSQSFHGITKQKVLVAYSHVIDALLLGGQIPFKLEPSPWEGAKIEDLPPDQQEQVQDQIDDFTALIKQQLTDSRADRALTLGVMSAAVYGLTWAKRIVQVVQLPGWKQKQVLQGYGGITDTSRMDAGMVVQYEQQRQRFRAPGWAYVPCWDMFWDMENEDDLQSSAGMIHRQMVSPWWLGKMRVSGPSGFWIVPNIVSVLAAAEGKDQSSLLAEDETASLAPYLRDVQHRQNTIRILEYWGRVPRAEVEAIEAELAGVMEIPNLTMGETEDRGDEVECLIGVANDKVVRFARTEESDRPFEMAKWEANIDEVSGVGVADNLRDVQHVLNGALRAFEDNKKLVCDMVIALKREYIRGRFPKATTPGMILDIEPECDDARKAVGQIVYQDVGESLMSLINLFERYADDETLIPKLLQGVDSDPKENTAFEINQRLEKSGKYITSVIRNLDQSLIEPMVRSFYDYNMRDPDVEKGKGSYVVRAMGFQSYQDRVVRQRSLQSFLAIVMQSPELMKETKLRDVLRRLAMAMDLDPDEAVYTLKEKNELAAEQQPDPMQMAMVKEKEASAVQKQADASAKVATVQLKAADLEMKRAQQEASLGQPIEAKGSAA